MLYAEYELVLLTAESIYYKFWQKYGFPRSMFRYVKQSSQLGLGHMAQKIITIIIFISVDIDNYHDKCQIFIYFKFKARCLLQSESFRNQTINFP